MDHLGKAVRKKLLKTDLSGEESAGQMPRKGSCAPCSCGSHSPLPQNARVHSSVARGQCPLWTATYSGCRQLKADWQRLEQQVRQASGGDSAAGGWV